MQALRFFKRASRSSALPSLSLSRHLLSTAIPTSTSFRSHRCVEVNSSLVGKEVELSGWMQTVRVLGGGLVFGVLRDSSAVVQLCATAEGSENPIISKLSSITAESVVKVKGVVRPRPEKQVTDTPTGAIEVEVTDVTVLNAAVHHPLSPLEEDAREENRMRYRYIDLRRHKMQHNLRIRANAVAAARNFLNNQNFMEVETPTLFRSTPEGAREFLVPTRTPGKFFALVQSPQQYKQMLIASSVDRYFQFARCYRDESGRADRQPEFTQIDMECAFVTQADIYNIIEGLVCAIVKGTLNKDLPRPFPHMKFSQAIARYGSDKPDRRLGMEIHTLENSKFSSALLSPSAEGNLISAFIARGLGKSLSRADLASLLAGANPSEKEKIYFIKCEDAGMVASGPAAKLTQAEREEILEAVGGCSDGDLIVLHAGPQEVKGGSTLMGRIRLALAAPKREEMPPSWEPFWVVDFPLLQATEDGLQGKGAVEAVHHPFTSPLDVAAAMPLIEKAANGSAGPLEVAKLCQIVSQHYDIVMDGMELGGGSIRIHNATLQRQVLELVTGDADLVQQRFGHLLEVLSSGCPPHGGIALGFDRLVSILAGCKNIRDVIAFPKSAQGQELLTGAPAEATLEQLRQYHISVLKPANNNNNNNEN